VWIYNSPHYTAHSTYHEHSEGLATLQTSDWHGAKRMYTSDGHGCLDLLRRWP
jgi:hypothetical protein